MLPLVLHLDGNVDQFSLLAEPCAVIFRSLGRKRPLRPWRPSGHVAGRYLPDVQIADDRIAVAIHGTPDFIRQIGWLRPAVQQDAACIADQPTRRRRDNEAVTQRQADTSSADGASSAMRDKELRFLR